MRREIYNLSVIKIIIEVIVLLSIFLICNAAIENKPDKKRLYKVMMGLAYMVTAWLSCLIAGYWGESIVIYIIFSFICSVGSFLSAINTNLREIYMTLLLSSIFIFLEYCLYENHKIISIILFISTISMIIDNIKESVVYMKSGIDPDILREENKKISNFKLLKYAFRLWRIIK